MFRLGSVCANSAKATNRETKKQTLCSRKTQTHTQREWDREVPIWNIFFCFLQRRCSQLKAKTHTKCCVDMLARCLVFDLSVRRVRHDVAHIAYKYKLSHAHNDRFGFSFCVRLAFRLHFSITCLFIYSLGLFQ